MRELEHVGGDVIRKVGARLYQFHYVGDNMATGHIIEVLT